jgi:hypothetical protein
MIVLKLCHRKFAQIENLLLTSDVGLMQIFEFCIDCKGVSNPLDSLDFGSDFIGKLAVEFGVSRCESFRMRLRCRECRPTPTVRYSLRKNKSTWSCMV